MIVRTWVAAALLICSSAQAGSDLETLLAQMDRAAAEFRGMQAKLRWVKYTAIVEDESVEEGVIKILRGKDGEFRLLVEFQAPYSYFFAVRGEKAEIYRPRIATVEEYDLSNSKAALEQALLLGFGTGGRFLSEHYNLTWQGRETAAGEATVKLELIPKAEKMAQRIPRLEMWVSKASWQPVQQKLYLPTTGDYRLYTYTEIALNPRLRGSDLRLKIPRGVKRVYPQR